MQVFFALVLAAYFVGSFSCSSSNFCKSLVHHAEPRGQLEVTPTNVGTIFQLPLEEAQAAKFTYLIQVYMKSNDLVYKPTVECSQYENGTFSCWAQVKEDSFSVSIWVSRII